MVFFFLCVRLLVVFCSRCVHCITLLTHQTLSVCFTRSLKWIMGWVLYKLLYEEGRVGINSVILQPASQLKWHFLLVSPSFTPLGFNPLEIQSEKFRAQGSALHRSVKSLIWWASHQDEGTNIIEVFLRASLPFLNVHFFSLSRRSHHSIQPL